MFDGNFEANQFLVVLYMYRVVQKNCPPGFYKISRLGDGFIQNRKKQHKAHIEDFPMTLVTFRDFL